MADDAKALVHASITADAIAATHPAIVQRFVPDVET